MKQLIKWSVPVLAATLIGLNATAGSITGTIRLAGSVTLNSQNLATATSATFSNPAGAVASGTGSYAGIPGIPSPLAPAVTFQNFTFGATGPEVVANLWSFVYSGLTYSFSLTEITSVTKSSTDLLIKGNGNVNITGFDQTPANWSIDITDTSGGSSGSFTFGFTDSNTAVPDGGTTVMLLGAALTGLGLIKRKLVA